MLDPLTITGLFGLGESIINKFFPDEQSRAEAMYKLKKLESDGNLAELQAYVTLLQGQLQINMKEAEHRSVFVSGWRPFVGWVCGFSLAYAAILYPIMKYVAVLSGWDYNLLPELDTTVTLQTLTGMLGFGAMRMYEKTKKVASNSIGGKE